MTVLKKTEIGAEKYHENIVSERIFLYLGIGPVKVACGRGTGSECGIRGERWLAAG